MRLALIIRLTIGKAYYENTFRVFHHSLLIVGFAKSFPKYSKTSSEMSKTVNDETSANLPSELIRYNNPTNAMVISSRQNPMIICPHVIFGRSSFWNFLNDLLDILNHLTKMIRNIIVKY